MIKITDIEAVPLPTPANIRAELERLDISQGEAAELLRINERTFRRYLQDPGTIGATPMPFSMFALLQNTRARR